MTTKTNIEAVNSGQTEREALLPCPFCGDKAEYKHNSLHGDESMAVCRCCGAQAFWSKWQARALLASKSAVPVQDEIADGELIADLIEQNRTLRARLAAPASPSGEGAAEQADEADFKNFHRLLCERFGYVHDEADWKRDQLSLIEHIASKQTIDAGRYSRFRRWHPRLQTSYWTGQWWEPIYGEKMDACIDGLDEVPQPTPHADQSAARAKEQS